MPSYEIDAARLEQTVKVLKIFLFFCAQNGSRSRVIAKFMPFTSFEFLCVPMRPFRPAYGPLCASLCRKRHTLRDNFYGALPQTPPKGAALWKPAKGAQAPLETHK
jgi:hypothetical protein